MGFDPSIEQNVENQGSGQEFLCRLFGEISFALRTRSLGQTLFIHVVSTYGTVLGDSPRSPSGSPNDSTTDHYSIDVLYCRSMMGGSRMIVIVLATDGRELSYTR